MKKYLLTAVLLFSFTCITYSQQSTKASGRGYSKFPYWIKMMDDTLTNYFEAVNAFDTYWKNRILPVEENEILSDVNKKKEERKNFLEKLFASRKEKRKEESERYAFDYKKFKHWQLLMQPYVQDDGRILYPYERLQIWRQQQSQK